MPRPGGGGGGGNNLFTTNIQGDGSVGSDLWINLGTIPTGLRVWFGNATYISPDKSITFELRTNVVGKSNGTENDTSLLYSTAVSSKTGSKFIDYYKNGRLHIVTVYGTGVERFWLRLKSKGSAGSFMYTINYTTE